ncbi:hypothetical protein SAMN05421785_10268 [Chryseobacterium gambrini]|uniref:Uncharacterized protein n=1 Tax=Chryseobacterium gambrini TaxID=373672 RepID=A0A1N7L949_9FLAO|nr:hypothetical protein SAMN05421785_10268 [Chryseobacterium gambrini]
MRQLLSDLLSYWDDRFLNFLFLLSFGCNIQSNMATIARITIHGNTVLMSYPQAEAIFQY